ncbi:ASPIC/UnbV domain-containing protein [Sphingobium yanoikuyae]|nr:ASPIC/UnbV domain-containing protein [Sphingobium yanoikuyae]
MVSTGGGYGAQSVTPLHFGLASMDKVSVAVTWLTAQGRKVQWINNVRPADYRGRVLDVRQKP